MDSTLGTRLRELSGPILITGHTGFKGSWLTLLLERLDVPVIGLSLPPEPDSLYARLERRGAIAESYIDIRNIASVREFIAIHRPSAIIHLAAQPLVLESYKLPRETFETNVMGTVNVLESSFITDSVRAVVVVTTDKVYKNDGVNKLFVESDPLQGKDPYSASKVGVEASVTAWQQIAKFSGGPKIISVRAGNVIGGGDWAKDRIFPDLIRAFATNTLVEIRNPSSTRPWQHVLDPLRGYLMALEAILRGVEIDVLNFGPDSESLSVRDVVEICRQNWSAPTLVEFTKGFSKEPLEAISLNLNSEEAKRILSWSPNWSQEEAIVATIKWWKQVFSESVSPFKACQSDIDFLLSF